MVALTALKKDAVFAAVRHMYTAIALYPDRDYHFPIGRAACSFVGYPHRQVARLPPWAVESFSGVGYPFAAKVIRPGDSVLDIGSGSGTDLLIAAHQTGDGGEVIGVDMTAAMVEKVSKRLVATGMGNVRVLHGNAEHVPVPAGTVDVVTSNGVFNLVPDKWAALAEAYRVLRPGGRLQFADIGVGRPLLGECVSDPLLWAECIVGATVTEEYGTMLQDLGFARIELLGRLDYFAGAASPVTRSMAASFRACSFVLRAIKPPVSPLPKPRDWPPRASKIRNTSQPPIPGSVLFSLP
jgi:arsenite methyltransferase